MDDLIGIFLGIVSNLCFSPASQGLIRGGDLLSTRNVEDEWALTPYFHKVYGGKMMDSGRSNQRRASCRFSMFSSVNQLARPGKRAYHPRARTPGRISGADRLETLEWKETPVDKSTLRLIRGRWRSIAAALLVFWLLSLASLQAQESLPATEKIEGPSSWEVLGIAPGTGQKCLVCRKILNEDINAVSLRYRGREFAVGEPLMGEFEAQPDFYFSQLQPRGALFDETQSIPTPLGDGWLFLGLYVLSGLLLGGVGGYMSVHRGRSPSIGFFAGLFLNVVGVAIVFALPSVEQSSSPEGIPAGLRKVPLTHSPHRCSCGETNHPSSTRCPACGRDLVARVKSEVGRAR